MAGTLSCFLWVARIEQTQDEAVVKKGDTSFQMKVPFVLSSE